MKSSLSVLGEYERLIFRMLSDRSRILLRNYEVDDDDHNPFAHPVIQGSDNPTFADDDVTSRQRYRPDLDIDPFKVVFRTDTETVDISHPQDSTIPPEETLTNEENEQASDEEVAANVSNTDDPTIPVLTFRSWFLGLLFTCLLSFVNQFFWYRTSPLFVGTLVAQLLTYPLGKTMAKVLPQRKFKILRWTFSLNPGPFNIKEHCIITAMANATCVCLFSLSRSEWWSLSLVYV